MICVFTKCMCCCWALVAVGSRLENMPFNYLCLYIRKQKGGGVKRQGEYKKANFQKRKMIVTMLLAPKISYIYISLFIEASHMIHDRQTDLH